MVARFRGSGLPVSHAFGGRNWSFGIYSAGRIQGRQEPQFLDIPVLDEWNYLRPGVLLNQRGGSVVCGPLPGVRVDGATSSSHVICSRNPRQKPSSGWWA